MNVKEIIETVAYSGALSFGGWKIIQNFYSFLKSFKSNKQQDSNVTVNLSAPPTREPTDWTVILYLLAEQFKIQTAVTNMKNNILKTQMDYYSRQSQEIYVEITNAILKLLKESSLNNQEKIIYFNNFDNFIEMADNRVQKLFRGMCKDNHFAEYKEKDYREVVDRNIKIITGTLCTLMRTRFLETDLIKNTAFIEKKKALIVEALDDCLVHAREVSIEETCRIKEASECFEETVSSMIGQKWSMTI